MDVSTLFSNQELLLKYNKEVPKTWDELMNTSKYIYEEEKKLNNTIIRYNGLINGKNNILFLIFIYFILLYFYYFIKALINNY